MSLTIDIQRACMFHDTPSDINIQRWCEAALKGRSTKNELNIRIVEEHESAKINLQFRSKSKSTNVLSFPFEGKVPQQLPILGDLVICAPVVNLEAEEQQKSAEAHWAHMVVHGILHLLGFDHCDDNGAESMELLETEILLGMGYSSPYQSTTEKI